LKVEPIPIIIVIIIIIIIIINIKFETRKSFIVHLEFPKTSFIKKRVFKKTIKNKATIKISLLIVPTITLGQNM